VPRGRKNQGHGIAGNLCRHYPGWLLYGLVALLFVANTTNIGADLCAMGDAVQLLIGGRRRSMWLSSDWFLWSQPSFAKWMTLSLFA
jgi:hypothetical protein